jgi:hypothetical protein
MSEFLTLLYDNILKCHPFVIIIIYHIVHGNFHKVVVEIFYKFIR